MFPFSQVDELTNIVADVIGDPTLPRSEDHPCPKCKHREAVFFQVGRRQINNVGPSMGETINWSHKLGLVSIALARFQWEFRVVLSGSLKDLGASLEKHFISRKCEVSLSFVLHADPDPPRRAQHEAVLRVHQHHVHAQVVGMRQRAASRSIKGSGQNMA